MIYVRLDFVLDNPEGLSMLQAIGELSRWLDEMFENHDTSQWTVNVSLESASTEVSDA